MFVDICVSVGMTRYACVCDRVGSRVTVVLMWRRDMRIYSEAKASVHTLVIIENGESRLLTALVKLNETFRSFNFDEFRGPFMEEYLQVVLSNHAKNREIPLFLNSDFIW